MKPLYKVTLIIKSENKSFEIYFDDQDRAERFMFSLESILNDEEKKDLQIDPEIVGLCDCDEDITDAIEQAFSDNKN